MDRPLKLDLSLAHRSQESYTVELEVSDPNSQATPAPEHGTARFNLDRLEETALDPTAYGRLLFRALFAADNLLSLFDRALAVAQSKGCPLSLRLFIFPDAAELHALRWELLHDERPGGGWLLTRERFRFARFVGSEGWEAARPRPGQGLRSLVVIANPQGLAEGRFQAGGSPLAPLDVAGEIRRARDSLGEGLRAEDILVSDPARPAGKPTLEGLISRLREGFDILYLVCHGALVTRGEHKGPYLLLEQADGSGDFIPGEALVEQVRALSPDLRPRLVVLASCQSAGTGGEDVTADLQGALAALGPQLALAGVPAVLAMQGSVSLPTVSGFMPVFFRELRVDGQVERAMAVARSAVWRRSDSWMPALYLNLPEDQPLLPPLPAAASLKLSPFEPETVFIPGGQFRMGVPAGSGRPGYESPQHEVDLPPFRIGKFPVTNAQYGEFVRQTGRLAALELGWDGQSPPQERLSHPVAGVTWYEAMAYCQWLSVRTGRVYGLPNEAQWEKAARGTDGRLYPWGNAWETGRANAGSGPATAVGAYPPQSIYGVYDLVGNVREWTCSLWGENRLEPDRRYAYPWAEDGRNDLTASSLIRRVFRGGAAADPPAELTCTARSGYAPDRAGPPGKRHGFRVVLLL